MKVAFLSTFALDANISLINALRETCDIYFFTEALYEIYNFIDGSKLKQTITKGHEVEVLQRFGNLISLDKTFVVKGTRNANIIKKLSISYKIHQELKKINPDVIVIDNYMLTYFLTTLSWREKMLMIVHDPFLHSGENFVIDRYLRKIHFKLIPHKILLNFNQKNEFVEYYREDSSKVFTSFLSVYDYLRYYVSGSHQQENSGSFNVLFFGRISPYKGIKYLLDGFVKMLKAGTYDNISLTIAGSGSFDFDIDPYKKYSQITIINRFITPSDLADLISQSSVVVCPYTDATQSGVVMSAFAFQKPVIATNVGGLPEMVEDRKTGMIIEPKSSECIYNALSELYLNRDLLKEMAQNIENTYFSGEKSWRNSAGQFMNAIEKVNRS